VLAEEAEEGVTGRVALESTSPVELGRRIPHRVHGGGSALTRSAEAVPGGD
jgi:hypothetical protein